MKIIALTIGIILFSFVFKNKIIGVIKRLIKKINLDTSSQNYMATLDLIKRRSDKKNYQSIYVYDKKYEGELPEIDLCMVSFNSQKWLEIFFKSLESQNYPLDKINLYFTDNGSKDETISKLEKYFADKGHLYSGFKICHEENLGFGHGTDNSIKQGKSEFCLITNIDLEFLQDSLINVVKMAIADRDSNVASWELRQAFSEMPKYYDPVTLETNWSSHACILIKREVYEKVGGYDKNIFMYAEDVEFSYRLRSQGYVLKYVPMATIIHHTVEYYGQIKPIELEGCISGNIYLRLKYGTIVDKLKGLLLLGCFFKNTTLRDLRKPILGKTIRYFKAYCKSPKISSIAYFPFRNFDYEQGRLGHAYKIITDKINENILVDIILVLSTAKDLENTLISIFNQTYRNFHISLLNVSGESIESKIVGFGSYQDRITIHNVKSLEELNNTISLCEGAYFMLLQCGDLLYSDHIEVLLKELLANKACVAAYSNASYMDQNLELHDFDFKKWCYADLLNNNYMPISALLNKNLFVERGGLKNNKEGIFKELWLRYGYGNKFVAVPKTTYIAANKDAFNIECLRNLEPFDKEDNKYLEKHILQVAQGRLEKKDSSLIITNNSERKSRIAGQMHIYYVDLAKEFFEYSNNIEECFDLYITTDSKDKAFYIAEVALNISNASKIIIDCVPNRGRDVAPFILQMQGSIFDYEYFFHIHTKKSYHNNFGNKWREYMLNLLLSGQNASKNIIDIFDKDCKVGIVIPKPMPEMIPFMDAAGNKEYIDFIMNRLGIENKNIDYSLFPAGDMFWGRTVALKQIFSNEFSLDMFPEELGQQDGTIMHAIERSWCHIAKMNGFSTEIIDKNKHIEKNSYELNRIALYTFWEENGYVGDYVLQYLKGLKEVASRIVVIVNGTISDKGLELLKNLGIEVLRRENIGLDFAAWNFGLQYVGFDNLSQYDELILCNCSCYGPIGGFRDSLEEMSFDYCDFWGYTLHKENRTEFIVAGDPDSYIREHLQSYFIVLKNKVIMSEAFRKWWIEFVPCVSFRDEVNRHENRFTEYLAQNGFLYSSYYKNDSCLGDVCFEKIIEVLDSGVPIFKRKIFSLPNYVVMEALKNITSSEVLIYLENVKKYDTSVVIRDLLDTGKYTRFKENILFSTNNEIVELKAENVNYSNSSSWKLTKPIRTISQYIRYLKDRFIYLPNFYNLYGKEGLYYKIKYKLGLYAYPKEQLPNFEKDIPIFVITYNRLDCLKKLLEFLESKGLMDNVVIIDNNSSYGLLLQYLSTLNCKVCKLTKNYGHLVLWKCHLFDEIILNKPFILTDCDVVPMEDIPDDFIEVMYNKLKNNQNLTKVGLSLYLDDIPDSYDRKSEVIRWESKFWAKRMEDKMLFDAPIDTTFAVYRPNVPPSISPWWNSARMDLPYCARHLGWYLDSKNPSDEDIWYANTVIGSSSAWVGKDYYEKTKI